MTYTEARELVTQYLRDSGEGERNDIVIVDDETSEREFGWVFFYNSRKHVETGDVLFGLVGNAPLIVDRHTGKLHVTGTGLPTECYIRAYEATGDPHNYLDYVGSRVAICLASEDMDRNEAICLLTEIFSIDPGHAKDACMSRDHASKSAGSSGVDSGIGYAINPIVDSRRQASFTRRLAVASVKYAGLSPSNGVNYVFCMAQVN